MKLSSPAFSEGANILPKFTCDGGDTSPPLKIEGVPEQAKSLVLIADDPDAPGGTIYALAGVECRSEEQLGRRRERARRNAGKK